MKRPGLDPEELYRNSYRPAPPNPETEPYWLIKARERRERDSRNRIYGGKDDGRQAEPADRGGADQS